ncbi:MAG: Crp/Fnr family transcriptional regulator [Paracoccaceae bacterium]
MESIRLEEAPRQMVGPVHRKLSGFFDISNDTAEDLIGLCTEKRSFGPREPMVRDGDDFSGIYLMESGWAIRSRTLADGSRQIVNVGLPGDFLGVSALLFPRSNYDVWAKTPVETYHIEPDRLREVFRRDPDLAAAVLWVTAHEEAVLAERVVSLGRRGARMRAAHVLCEIIARIEVVEPINPERVMVPISQEEFADILGVSVVHANKTLRALDREGLIAFRNGILAVKDRPALERCAGFDNGYLHYGRVDPENRRRRTDDVARAG